MSGLRVTSPPDKSYNCIAWAAEDSERFWWPEVGGYWPPGATRRVTLSAFIEAYRGLGYETCGSEAVEDGFQKVAIFSDESGTPTHAARQLADGRWTSKLGRDVDVEHDLHSLQEHIPQTVIYGKVAVILRRPTDRSDVR